MNVSRRRYMGSKGGELPFEEQYLTFEALESGTFSIGLSLDYSIDNGTTWTTLAANTATPTIQAGNKILWRGNNTRINKTFSATGDFNVYGNIMSLLSNDFATKVSFSNTYVFQQLFNNNEKLISAENLVLPATTLTQGCYATMFSGCTSLTSVPELPATTLANSCYSSMFYNCTSLTTAQSVLPATTLGGSSYLYMFYGCTSLTTAPELYATTLGTSCLQGMFYGCKSLEKAPDLLATTLKGNCYYQMFYNCNKLATPPIISATTTESSCCYQMFRGCSSLTAAPELLSTTLASNCYYQMFNGCNKLNYVKCLATTISGATSNWLNGVSSTGTFVKNAAATDWPSGASGIPSNWAVIDV